MSTLCQVFASFRHAAIDECMTFVRFAALDHSLTSGLGPGRHVKALSNPDIHALWRNCGISARCQALVNQPAPGRWKALQFHDNSAQPIWYTPLTVDGRTVLDVLRASRGSGNGPTVTWPSGRAPKPRGRTGPCAIRPGLDKNLT